MKKSEFKLTTANFKKIKTKTKTNKQTNKTMSKITSVSLWSEYWTTLFKYEDCTT